MTAPQVRRGEEDERIVKMFDNNHDVVTKLLAMLDAKGLTSKFESRALDRVVSKAQRRLERRGGQPRVEAGQDRDQHNRPQNEGLEVDWCVRRLCGSQTARAC